MCRQCTKHSRLCSNFQPAPTWQNTVDNSMSYSIVQVQVLSLSLLERETVYCCVSDLSNNKFCKQCSTTCTCTRTYKQFNCKNDDQPCCSTVLGHLYKCNPCTSTISTSTVRGQKMLTPQTHNNPQHAEVFTSRRIKRNNSIDLNCALGV